MNDAIQVQKLDKRTDEELLRESIQILQKYGRGGLLQIVYYGMQEQKIKKFQD